MEEATIAYLIEQFARRNSAETPGEPSDDDETIRQRLLAIALDGLHARDTDPLPGQPPSAKRYEARWKSPT